MPFYIDPRIGEYTAGLFVEKCWLVRARCSGCGHAGQLTVADLLKLPPEIPIGDVVARLKCAECGGSEGYADFLQDRSAGHVKDMEEYRLRVKPGDRQ